MEPHDSEEGRSKRPEGAAGGRDRVGAAPLALAVIAGALFGIGLLVALLCAGGLPDERLTAGAIAAACFAVGIASLLGARHVLHARVERMREAAYRAASDPTSETADGRGSACAIASAGALHSRPVTIASVQRIDSSAEPESDDRADPLQSLLSGSDDTFATLRSLLESGGSDSLYRTLTAFLARTDLADWSDAPKAACRLLSRNGCYWIAADTDELTEDGYDCLMQVESALNLARNVFEDAPSADAESSLRGVQGRMAYAPFEAFDFPLSSSDLVKQAYECPGEAAGRSEWVQRLTLAQAAENAALPFRLCFDMRSDAVAGLVFIDLDIPRPRCFAVVAGNEADRISYARSYALSLAMAMARAALDAPPTKRAAVACHVHGSTRTLLSVELDADGVRRLQREIDRNRAPFDDPAVRVRFDDNGWFSPVEPHVRKDAPELHPERYLHALELDQTPCSADLRRVGGVQVVADLGISEDAERSQVWRRFADEAPSSIEGAVTRLMALRDESGRDETRAACDRLIRALAEGTADISDEAGMRASFFCAEELDVAIGHAREALASADRAAVERAVDELETALSGSVQFAYLDDTDAVYRYFGSVVERIFYNRISGPAALSGAGDTREVRLVPDAYYEAQETVARLLILLGRNDEALRYADEAMRIAPLSIDAGLIKARVLEGRSDFFAAANLVKRLIPLALSKHETALCLYRFAFFEWKLGHGQLAAACYRVAIGLRTSISPQATLEMTELASSQKLQPPSPDRAFARLDEEGIMLGCRQQTQDWVEACAILCTDEGLYPAAASLTGSLVELQRDDALVDVYRSLLPDPN